MQYEPAPHPIRVRAMAYELAIKELRSDGSRPGPRMIVQKAEEIAGMLWAGMEPVNRPATPLSTVDECLNALNGILAELIASCALSCQFDKGNKIGDCVALVERLRADVSAALV